MYSVSFSLGLVFIFHFVLWFRSLIYVWIDFQLQAWFNTTDSVEFNTKGMDEMESFVINCRIPWFNVSCMDFLVGREGNQGQNRAYTLMSTVVKKITFKPCNNVRRTCVISGHFIQSLEWSPQIDYYLLIKGGCVFGSGGLSVCLWTSLLKTLWTGCNEIFWRGPGWCNK